MSPIDGRTGQLIPAFSSNIPNIPTSQEYDWMEASSKSALNLDLFVNRQPLDHLLKLRKTKLCLYLQNYSSLDDSNLPFKSWGSPLDDEN